MSKNKEHETFLDSVIKYEPEINVIGKEIMDERISVVFNEIASTLQKSLGPLGAHAIISQAPNYHVTKDGFTIMKNIRYNSEYGYVDNVISGMIADICGRLNFAVGDGTTSAVLSANSMYQEFKNNNKKISKLFFLPRNVLNRTKELTEDVISRLESYALDIKNLSLEEMTDYIRQVVYVSSNADTEMTDTIVDLYKEIGYPAISVTKAKDGVTKGRTVEGFMFHAKLMDRLYVNNDNNSQIGKDYDLVIFDHKVSLNTYKYFLAPLSQMCYLRGRKLVCIAPNYDEVALQGDILNDLNAEYRRTHDINLVLMGYRSSRPSDKKRVSDLAMLCNTSLITQSIENEIVKRFEDAIKSKDVHKVLEFINLDNREIYGTKVITPDGSDGEEMGQYILVEDSENTVHPYRLNSDFVFRVGYCAEASLHIDKESVFRGFHYDKPLYDKYLADAKKELDDALEKYKRLGTFNFEVDDAQKRYLSLGLKMGEIEVGAKTDFSQEFLVDAMDDAVKAAQSAYRNGVINGGHTTLLKAIAKEMESPERSEGDKFLLNVMFNAFRHVRFCVFENGFKNEEINLNKLRSGYHSYGVSGGIILDIISEKIGVEVLYQSDINELYGVEGYLLSKYSDSIDLFTLINEVELFTDTVLDLDMGSSSIPTIAFNKKVINSTATDREILIASSDLVGLLTTGNQLVISRGNY